MNRFYWICIVILSISPIPAAAAEEIKLSRLQEEILEQTPAERRDEVRRQFAESQKRLRDNIREANSAERKLMSRILKRIPELTTGDNLGSFSLMHDLRNDEFLAYVGLDKNKGEEIAQKMFKIDDDFERPDDILEKAATTDDPAELDKIAEKFLDTIGKVIQSQGETFQKSLTPEQNAKLRELRLINSSANIGGGMNFIFDFGQYAALELTDEQRHRLDAIRADYTRDFQPLMEKVGEVRMKVREQLVETGDYAEAEKSLKTELEDAEKPLAQLNAATRAKVSALLSKKQTAKLERILAGAPKYLAKRVGLIKEDEEWKKSWKPGDPIPEGAVPDRPHGIFPMGL